MPCVLVVAVVLEIETLMQKAKPFAPIPAGDFRFGHLLQHCNEANSANLPAATDELLKHSDLASRPNYEEALKRGMALSATPAPVISPILPHKDNEKHQAYDWYQKHKKQKPPTGSLVAQGPLIDEARHHKHQHQHQQQQQKSPGAATLHDIAHSPALVITTAVPSTISASPQALPHRGHKHVAPPRTSVAAQANALFLPPPPAAASVTSAAPLHRLRAAEAHSHTPTPAPSHSHSTSSLHTYAPVHTHTPVHSHSTTSLHYPHTHAEPSSSASSLPRRAALAAYPFSPMPETRVTSMLPVHPTTVPLFGSYGSDEPELDVGDGDAGKRDMRRQFSNMGTHTSTLKNRNV